MEDKKGWGGGREGVRSFCLSSSPLSITVFSLSLFVFVSIHLNSVEWFIGIQSIFKSQQLALYTFSLYWHDGFENMYYYIVHRSSISVIKKTRKFCYMNNWKASKGICVHVCLVVSTCMYARFLKESPDITGLIALPLASVNQSHLSLKESFWKKNESCSSLLSIY